MREKFTFSDTPWITTTTDFFAALDFDYGVGPNNGERDTLSQLSHRLCLFFVFQWFGEVINPDLVLRDFVQNLKKVCGQSILVPMFQKTNLPVS